MLGGAILLHDAGMTLAAYPRGVSDLLSEPAWADAIVQHFTALYGRRPTPNEISTPPEEVHKLSVAELLRELHAARAEQLPTAKWISRDGREHVILDDPELAAVFGRFIGQIAHSHWWTTDAVLSRLNRSIGAPHFLPEDWQTDLLLPACLLRVADATHIDAKRAPSFLSSLRRMATDSGDHWLFQGRLTRPVLNSGRLRYTATAPFAVAETAAWWLCYDVICQIDTELRRTNSLLLDVRGKRLALAATGVTNATDPELLAKDIPTIGWTPRDLRVRVGDVPNLITKLGGKELYGSDLFVPVRELIQNCCDAVRARRIYGVSRPDNWGSVCVSLHRNARALHHRSPR